MAYIRPAHIYLEAKADIVRMQPRRNAAGALLAALRDDWQVPVSIAGATESDGDHLATSDELTRRLAGNGKHQANSVPFMR